jgi:long-chain acyl-CoA synthetase
MTDTRTHASNPAELPQGTLAELFLKAVDQFREHPVFRFRKDGRWHDIKGGEVLLTVRTTAAALRGLGVERGDRAAILSPNRPEWALVDYACLSSGVVDVPVYSSLTASQIRFILLNAGARIVFASDSGQLSKILEIRDECPDLEWVVVFDPPDGEVPEGVLTWEELQGYPDADETLASEEGFLKEARVASPDDTATILYTSGTTGDPKGVMLSHGNLYSNIMASLRVLPVDQRDSTLSFLPLSHVFQRMVDYLFFSQGIAIAYAQSLETVADDLKEVRPTIVVSVPRLYEKVYARVTGASGVKGMLVKWARHVGEQRADALLAGETPSPLIRLQYGLVDRLVFSKLRDAVGGRLRYFVSGGAPLSPEINRFFFAAGIRILEGYGLTETSPVTNVNSDQDFPHNFRIGTVGKPVAGTEIRIADDGEILVRGPQVMKGYYRNPEATREVITEDGWFHTGDIGELDSDGFLKITDRKKDIIVTAGGKNIAPQPIENVLKENRYVEQAVLLGDRRKFVSLILVPDFEALKGWARSNGVSASEPRDLLTNSEVQKLIEGELAAAYRDLSRVEQPKKVILVDEEFTIEDGSLTPTQKVKRRVVEERYRDVIDEVYDESNEDRTFFTPW